ncbi:MAG TPA: hypothetical protein V6D47_08005 [Oscillatoriaceae cyanobacterium]
MTPFWAPWMSPFGATVRPSAHADASQGASPTAPFGVTGAIAGRFWERLERLTHTHPAFPDEWARLAGRQRSPEVVEAFGTETPASRDVLLHAAPNWQTRHGTPVLLVHGATMDGTCWTDPYGRENEGLAQGLVAAGRRVFAVTFAHRHGDNLLQRESLACAIARVLALTGAEQVDVVAHSKGTVAARALASGLAEPWMTPYRGEIRRLVMVGGPNAGIDYAFRHPQIQWALVPERDDPRLNAPFVWRRMLAFGVWSDTADRTLYTNTVNCFPGQAQMLARWDHVYPLSPVEPDWHTTYYGGQGLVSYSDGIDAAIAQGGHFLARLDARPLDPRIELVVLAGDRADRVGVLNETTGPSDGTVFVESATATDAMCAGGARLLRCEVLGVNHGELIYAPQAKQWLLETLLEN